MIEKQKALMSNDITMTSQGEDSLKLVSGTRGREFESHRPDHSFNAAGIEENEGTAGCETDTGETTDTELTQQQPESTEANVKWPKKVKHRNKVLAKIYRPCEGRGSYRVAWSVNDKRMMKSFPTYGGKGGALEYAEGLVVDLAKGSQVTALTVKQANDALAAYKAMQGFYEATGKRVTLHEVAAVFCAAMLKLPGRTLGEAVDGFLSGVANVKRIDLAEAVKEFNKEREEKTKPNLKKPDKRPALSRGYHYIVCMWLKEFAATFPNTAVCDLTKELMDTYMSHHSKVSERTRNGRRTTVGMFLKWCVCKDYLATGHRLLEATGMEQEDYEPEEIDFYRPSELAGLLQAASEQPAQRHLLPVVALGGLAGLRLQEAVRLTWDDVFKAEGHVTVSRGKSKTRNRRLVEICPALASWLEPYRKHSGPVWTHNLDRFHNDFNSLRASLEIPARRNGLRHAFVTYHLALHKNENLTAAEAGNSPAMIHGHYNGLGTPKEAVKWFSVAPQQPANVVPMGAAAKA